MSSPRVSFVVPVYNAARYLREAIQSIRAQTFGDFELIAVDDGSQDSSKEILDHFARLDPRMIVISRPNTGIVGALNDGLARARGEFIARMDGDDIALPGRLAAQVDYLERHPDCVALGTNVQIIDSRSAVVDRHDALQGHDQIVAELLQGNGGAIIHPSVVFRASALSESGRYDPAFCKVEDLDLYLRLARKGRLANLPILGLQYRHHVQSTNFVHRDHQLPLMHLILEREHEARGLRYQRREKPGYASLSAGRLHARWACSALIHGTRPTAFRHGISAVVKSPSDPECWRALKYVLTAQRPTTS